MIQSSILTIIIAFVDMSWRYQIREHVSHKLGLAAVD
jgi:hypothetical protein